MKKQRTSLPQNAHDTVIPSHRRSVGVGIRLPIEERTNSHQAVCGHQTSPQTGLWFRNGRGILRQAFAFLILILAGGYLLFCFFLRLGALRDGGMTGIFTFLTGDRLTLKEPVSLAASAPVTEAEEEEEKEELLIFTPDEGAIPYHVVDYAPPSVENEEPPKDAEPLKAVTIHSSMTPKNNPGLSFDADALLQKELAFDKKTMSILIIHTHGSEAYSAYKTAYWCKDMAARSEDPAESVVAVGRVLKSALEEKGFRVVHDETMCDVPHYNSSYKTALAVIEKHIREDPSIGMVLDVHRDSLSSSDGTRYKLVAGDGESSQIMFVVGSNALLKHDNWLSNLSFALKLQKEAMARYEDFVRPISISKNRYNEHMTPYSLIVECGTEANTLPEARKSAKRLALILDAVAS